MNPIHALFRITQCYHIEDAVGIARAALDWKLARCKNEFCGKEFLIEDKTEELEFCSEDCRIMHEKLQYAQG